MIELTETVPWPRLREGAREIRRRLGDFQRLHDRFGGQLLGWVERNFEAEGTLLEEMPAGWPPLAPATLAGRRKRGMGGKILQQSGRLREGSRIHADRERMLLFNPLPYAAKHQLGLGVPRRPFLPSEGQTRRIVDPVLTRFVEEALP